MEGRSVLNFITTFFKHCGNVSLAFSVHRGIQAQSDGSGQRKYTKINMHAFRGSTSSTAACFSLGLPSLQIHRVQVAGLSSALSTRVSPKKRSSSIGALLPKRRSFVPASWLNNLQTISNKRLKL